MTNLGIKPQAVIGVVWVMGLASGCVLRSAPVARIADGVEYSGRALTPQAYEHYARAELRVAANDDASAIVEYERALSEDSDAAEVRAKLGAAQCRSAGGAAEAMARTAETNLREALEQDPHSATAWLETARCALRFGQPERAFSAAKQAVSLDPSSENANSLVLTTAEASSDLAFARRWADAWVARQPNEPGAWRALLAFARRTKDLGRESLALTRLEEFGEPLAASTRLSRALLKDDFAAASVAATALGLRGGELAARAVQAGAYSTARHHSERLRAADPTDADSWAAALALAELERDFAEFERLLREPAPDSALSASARELLSALLARVAGEDARAAFTSTTAKDSATAR